MRLSPREHTISVSAGNQLPHSIDIREQLSPSKGLEAHPQVPTQQPVLLFHRQEWVKSVQQQFSHSRLSKVFDAPIEPTLEEVRGIGS